LKSWVEKYRGVKNLKCNDLISNVKHVEEDSNSSEEGQKGTAVIAIINTATQDHAS
jgi:hypothetical protein